MKIFVGSQGSKLVAYGSSRMLMYWMCGDYVDIRRIRREKRRAKLGKKSRLPIGTVTGDSITSPPVQTGMATATTDASSHFLPIQIREVTAR